MSALLAVGHEGCRIVDRIAFVVGSAVGGECSVVAEPLLLASELSHVGKTLLAVVGIEESERLG